MKRIWNWLITRQKGQSLVIVAIGMVALLSVAGLVVDVGNAYALQRKVRNAVDASALAAAREMARQGATSNANVLSAARRFASLNYIAEPDLEVWYADIDGNPLQPVNNDGFSPPTEVDGTEVASVLVQGRGSVSTYLAHLVGVHSFRSSESSVGRILCGACSAGGDGEGLFPAAISAASFASSDGKPVMGMEYTFWGDHAAPGNFGWLSWDGSANIPTLVANINDLTRSGRRSVGDLIPSCPGASASPSVRSALQARLNTHVTLPVYDQVTGEGAHASYRVVGFVRVLLTSFRLTGPDRDKYIRAQFTDWTLPSGEGGCADMGVCVVKLRPPMTERRSITGVVSIWLPRLNEGVVPSNEHRPVDVVNVMDISGSMSYRWGPGSEVKLATAKRVLTEFNGYLLPDEGDRVGLATFPRVTSGSWYTLLCGSSWKNTYYMAQVRSALTSNIAAVNSIIQGLSANGGTPLATGVQAGRQTVIPDGVAVAGRVPVLIVASDGIANCMVDGRWTGFSGNDTNSPPCNDMADQHAIEQANIAKQAGVIVFTVAIGDDFNSAVLRAMASADTDPTKPHFFQATSETDMEEIYRAIAVRINNIGSECSVEEFETTGENATVLIYKDGALYDDTTASNTGSYVFPDVEEGEYTFAVTMQKQGMTFDILTDVIGGPEAEEPITVTVGQGTGTYVRDLYVRTSTALVCQ